MDTHLHHDPPRHDPHDHHHETHFKSSESVRDVVIGMADGLTVPFALAAGLSGAIFGTHIVVTAGLAEIAAGSIAMGLGGYLAARSEAEHYVSEKKREAWEVIHKPEAEAAEIREVFEGYGLTEVEITPIIAALERNPEAYVQFMMRFELGLEEPNPKRALQSAITIGISYIIGGLIPLAPYIFLKQHTTAFQLSCIVTLLALFIFGFIKGRFTGSNPWRSAFETASIGGIAATVAYTLAKAFS
ncbi:VIT1/CCC1 transporter family protein [Armatimonas sp.]|uniref:VIT1/CCC1 transporter family protein n=1 Tax=Armatimonas sp. TaxID=1872638 RepID=UPI00374CE43A